MNTSNLNESNINKSNHFYHYYPEEQDNTPNTYYDELIINGSPNFLMKTEFGIVIYSALILLIIVVSIIMAVLFVLLSTRISRNIHDKVLEHLILAPIRFFQTNVSGGILNIFSKDMGSMDELLPRMILCQIQVR